ncbi:MAG TPA: hypothetical protein VE978_28145 [Chitinophagales bacterium]|nr:hypothetical protein [Chitinophagales bacterium]
MFRFINTILLLSLIVQFAAAQMKTIDIPGVRPDDVKVDRMSNGWYFIATTDEGKALITFYDENFTVGKKVELKIAGRKAREAIYTSDSNFLCIGFPKIPNGHTETDFSFYVLTTSRETIATRTFQEIEIKSLVMDDDRIFMVTVTNKDRALHCHLLDLGLNTITEKLIPLENKNALEKVNAAFVSGDLLLAYTFTKQQENIFNVNMEVLGFRANDGVQFFNVREDVGEKNYSVNYLGKETRGTFIVSGEFSNREIFGRLTNSGVFKLVISESGEKLSLITKPWTELIAQVKHKYSALYTSEFGLNDVGIDYLLSQKTGFLIIYHLNFGKYAVFTDSVLNPVHTIELRQNENDMDDFVYEEVLCTLKNKTPIALLFMADSKEGFPALFASTLNANDPHFMESILLNGRNGNPKMIWTNKSKTSPDKLSDLENCNPSLIPSDPLHLVLFDDAVKDIRGARLYVYSVR